MPGCIYHLTHRCHDREFLFRFAKDRNGYRRGLRQVVLSTQVCLLAYIITSNHIPLVVWTEKPGQIAMLMQEAAGQFARDYNRRQQRSGAFWEGRYHATMVDSGEYLWEPTYRFLCRRSKLLLEKGVLISVTLTKGLANAFGHPKALLRNCTMFAG